MLNPHSISYSPCTAAPASLPTKILVSVPKISKDILDVTKSTIVYLIGDQISHSSEQQLSKVSPQV
jgi:hypothetical protein